MNKIPQTIEELKMAYIDKNLPSEETTRFFIGKDYKHPRAFGIYKDESTGNFVVYKNKADGTRAIRYEGPDEAFAVEEIYKRLCDEIINQKSNIANTRYRASRTATHTVGGMITYVMAIIVFLIAIIPMILSFKSPRRGYYLYNDNCYYYQNGDWYEYDSGWGREYDVPKTLKENYSDYFESTYYYSRYNASDFRYTSYYEEPTSSSSSSSYDSSSSWDSSDSWDSSSTDWDSDW